MVSSNGGLVTPTTSFTRFSCPICAAVGDINSFGKIVPPYFSFISEDKQCVFCHNCVLGIELYPPKNQLSIYEDYSNKRDGPTDIERLHHDIAIGRLRVQQFKAAVDYPTRGRKLWVDFGCALGGQLIAASREGFEVCGVECNKARAAAATALSGQTCLLSTDRGWFEHNTRTDLTVVSFYDVLEHLWDPISALHKAATFASHIVIEVPDLSSCASDNTLDGYYKIDGWKHRRRSEQGIEHIWHFTPIAMEHLAERCLPDFEIQVNKSKIPGRLTTIYQRKQKVNAHHAR